VSRSEAERRREAEGKKRLFHNAVTCGSAECQRAREAVKLRERHGPGKEYAAEHARR
jgi:hypothetical protein